ncbi:hypothetical protein BH11ARM2_BH11ARM2_19370 [soil metagenome]
MAGGYLEHSQLITNLSRLFGNATQGKICRYLGSETKVLIGKGPRYFYPDGTISCPPNAVNRRSGVIDNPRVVFEVLSPGTEDYDRGEKFFASVEIEVALDDLYDLYEYVIFESDET